MERKRKGERGREGSRDGYIKLFVVTLLLTDKQIGMDAHPSPRRCL